ncbi:hypothetical protein AFERRI_10039 [Acidithiobacillus ferrivorans]|uniref:Uncharacterized protein n=1 Tax=Acidithiobacillus ferrivorans TaxID=160808 RepID=A0A060V0D8_9PROT|nr:hypothetical protein AFERRI_10039 [Acidithiobacillus ferrivorans]
MSIHALQLDFVGFIAGKGGARLLGQGQVLIVVAILRLLGPGLGDGNVLVLAIPREYRQAQVNPR